MNLRDAENTPLWQCLQQAWDCPSNNSDISGWSLTWLWEDLQWHEQRGLGRITSLQGCFALPLASAIQSLPGKSKSWKMSLQFSWHRDTRIVFPSWTPVTVESQWKLFESLKLKGSFCPKIASLCEQLKLLGTENYPNELICLFKNNTFWKWNHWFQQAHIKYFREKKYSRFSIFLLSSSSTAGLWLSRLRKNTKITFCTMPALWKVCRILILVGVFLRRGLQNVSPALVEKKKKKKKPGRELFLILFLSNASNAGKSSPLVCSAVSKMLPRNVYPFHHTFQTASTLQR